MKLKFVGGEPQAWGAKLPPLAWGRPRGHTNVLRCFPRGQLGKGGHNATETGTGNGAGGFLERGVWHHVNVPTATWMRLFMTNMAAMGAVAVANCSL